MTLRSLASCFRFRDVKEHIATQGTIPIAAGAQGTSLLVGILKKGSEAGRIRATGSDTDAASVSSGIPAGHVDPAYRPSTDAPSTSYPMSYGDDWDAVGAYMTTANEMEACVDAVLEGSIKSAQTMFERYDMNLDGRLNQQDYYDLMLELNLALTVQDYQRFVDATFSFADADCDCLISVHDFIPLYKAIAAARRAFRHQDHHHNGQIDRHDFYQVLAELGVSGGNPGLRATAEAAFCVADSTNRGIVNFGQLLVWYGSYLAAIGSQELQKTQAAA